jgi:LemA protein
MAQTQAQKTFPKKWIGIGIIVLIILILVGIIWGSYNGLVGLNQNVDKEWANIEAQYQRRFDLIPNLVNVVESYAKYEKELLTNITNLRSQWQTQTNVNEQMNTANQFESTLSRLLLVAENYPDLKASANFISLQDSLAETENMISVARTRYNSAVRDYNAMTKYFPSNIIANWFNFMERPYFEAKPGAETVPQVNLTV